MRTRQALHGFLSRHMMAHVRSLRGMGLYHSLLHTTTHDRPSTHLRQRQRRASFKVGASSAGHQAAVSDEENTFHLHLSRPPHLALESLTHQSSFLSLFEAPIALITPRTGSEAERKHRVRATRGRGPAYKHTNTLALWAWFLSGEYQPTN